jgi:hypothetical protein
VDKELFSFLSPSGFGWWHALRGDARGGMMGRNEEVKPLDEMPITLQNWMSSQDAAAYLRMTVGALRTAVCKGTVVSYKWRRRLYFKKSELDRMIEKGRMGW